MVRGAIAFVWFAVIMQYIASAPLEHTTQKSITSSGRVNNTVVTPKTNQYVPISVQKGCSLSPENETLTSSIKRDLQDGTTMIEFSLKFRGEDFLPENITGRTKSKMFKPFFWVRTTGRFGTRLLLLKPNYDIMSFKSLEIKVKKFKNITLTENPPNCMEKLTYEDIEQILRELVMDQFANKQPGDTDEETSDSVCNLHISDNGGADYTYYCCKRDKYMELKCEYLESDIWLFTMRIVIKLLKLIFILYCPLLIPLNMMQAMDDKRSFLYKLPNPYKFTVTLFNGNPKKEKCLRQLSGQGIGNGNAIEVPITNIKHMKKFKQLVQDLRPGQKKVFSVTQAEIQTEQTRLVSPGEAPSRIFETLYEFMVNCRVRELPSVEPCCNSNICCCCNFKLPFEYTWYKFSRAIMKCVVAIVLVAPWIIRMIVYYRYEHEEMMLRKEAAQEKGYTFTFQGNFAIHLTPLHTLFIFIYIFLFIESVIYGNLNEKTKEKFRMIFRKCYTDMSNDKRTKAFGGIMQLLLRPFESLGCWVVLGGVFMWIVLLPIALVLFVFYMFPTVNLTIRLLAHLAFYTFRTFCPSPKSLRKACNTTTEASQSNNTNKPSTFFNLRQQLTNIVKPKEFELENMVCEIDCLKNERVLSSLHGRMIQLIAILFCMVTLYSGILLLFEMVTFFLDVFIYTLIGSILYADFTMAYISLAVLLLVYGKDCFGSVSQRYREYSVTLNRYVMSLCEKAAITNFFTNKPDQVNRAFVVKPCKAGGEPCITGFWPDQSDVSMGSTGGMLHWRMKKLVFFLTNKDVPKIPTKLLFDASQMGYINEPGRLLHQYLRALFHFLMIVAFLLFVLLVVMTFGENGKISASNQLLATIAGGILPFLLRNFIFKSHLTKTIDPDKDINFRVAIHDTINNLEQTWLIQDINAEPIETSNNTQRNFDEANSDSDIENNTESNSKTKSNRKSTHEQSVESIATSDKENGNKDRPNADITNGTYNTESKRHSSIRYSSLETGDINISNGEVITHEHALATHNSINENLTNIVIYFNESDLDKFDFPTLYGYLHGVETDQSMMPLRENPTENV